MSGGDNEASDKSRRGVHPALAGVVLALGLSAIFAGLVATGRLSFDEESERAPGLRGEELPEGLHLETAPRIKLADSRGRMLDTAELRGEPYLVTFLYTQCPDECPVIGQDIRRALAELGDETSATRAIAVSVDPAGDSPEAVERWIADQDLPESFRYLIGDEESLRPIWEQWFTVPAGQRVIDPRTHATSVWVVDADGRLRSRYSAGAEIDPADLAYDLRALSR